MKRSTIPTLMALLSLLLFSTITCKKDNDEKANILPMMRNGILPVTGALMPGKT
nr:hypothetical protein [Bacteroidota bacterium]